VGVGSVKMRRSPRSPSAAAVRLAMVCSSSGSDLVREWQLLQFALQFTSASGVLAVRRLRTVELERNSVMEKD
jgi:hypothetical protein